MKSLGRSESPRFHPSNSPFAVPHSSSSLTAQSQLHSTAGSFLPVSGTSYLLNSLAAVCNIVEKLCLWCAEQHRTKQFCVLNQILNGYKLLVKIVVTQLKYIS